MTDLPAPGFPGFMTPVMTLVRNGLLNDITVTVSDWDLVRCGLSARPPRPTYVQLLTTRSAPPRGGTLSSGGSRHISCDVVHGPDSTPCLRASQVPRLQLGT